MDFSNVKMPTSKEEMDALRKSLRQEIDEDDLDAVAGGNANPIRGKQNIAPWTCPGCGATLMVSQSLDCVKHMTKCPGNPYK